MGLVVLWGLLHYGVCRLLGGPVAYGICRSIEKSFFNVFLTLQYSKYSEIWLCGVNNTVELDNAEIDSAIPKTVESETAEFDSQVSVTPQNLLHLRIK